MKANWNYSVQGNYYIGLDVGTNSVGWAVTDEQYHMKKFKGNAMWGVRLFEDAKSAEQRRVSRVARRRLERKKQRLMLLELLFAEEIAKIDPQFYLRMRESDRWADEKQSGSKYSLFHDTDYTDKEYHQSYPTVYHLRSELLGSSQPHDIRLVYLAVHHIMKNRGHFLYEMSDHSNEIMTVPIALEELQQYIQDHYGRDFEPENREQFVTELQRNDIGVTEKKKMLKKAYGRIDECEELGISALLELLAGASVKLAVLFADPDLKNGEVSSVSLKDIDENADTYVDALGDRIGLLESAKTLFDAARLAQVRGDHTYISQAKVAQYEQNRSDLRQLKRYVRRTIPDKYNLIFSERQEKLNNYAAYSQYGLQHGDYHCGQEAFCKFLLGKEVGLPKPEESDTEMSTIYAKVKDGIFLPRLRGSENGVIPYQLNRQELVQILKNASTYLPFLNRVDEDGLSLQKKIIQIFEFRVPYYVGPVSNRAGHHWAVRFSGKEQEKIFPWNFEQIVDTESSAAAFMKNLVGRCTYTGEPVLPKDSLLYSEFALLNEINPIQVNRKPLPLDVKKQLVQDLFYRPEKGTQKRTVTKKDISNYLISRGLIGEGDEISGVDDKVKSKLRSWYDFEDILSRTGDRDMVEDIIRSILVFGKDKKMLRRWLKKNTHGLTEDDVKHICCLKYQDWGRLSKTLLTEIYSPDKYGEAKTIMDYLRDTNLNLMQLLSDDFQFASNAKAHFDALYGNGQTLSQRLDNLYIAPAVRRSIRQTLRIVDEIVDIEKGVPKKIFIEMARDDARAIKKKRTESRKDKLISLYKACKEGSGELFERLANEDENRLRSDKLYLYYTQFGRCMYSEEPIVLDALLRGEKYDIDHIFPQSKIKDNSLDNRVLVKNTLNREKTDEYPIKTDIRQKMQPFWYSLKQKNLISQKKYDRLTRGTKLTNEELSSFVARQLVETRQSTKALATLLKETYGNMTRIVYSKAGNVSDFRQKFGFVKCRDINDLHHAKDAYLNIVVGNVYDTKFTKQFFANIQMENYSLKKVFDFNTPEAWNTVESIQTVKKYMTKNNVLVTRMPHEAKGALYDLQIMPAGKGQLPKKNGMSTERYGGYNKLTGAYFCIVEHTDKKKRVRTIEPVFLYQKEAYERDPVIYCQSILGLKEPVIIASKVRIDTTMELNGNRLLITSRTGNTIIFKHTYQMIVGSEFEQYIKNLSKYNDRCKAKREELPVTSFDGISREKNMELYQLLTRKCGESVYRVCSSAFTIMGNEMAAYEDKFAGMSLWTQVKLLLEALNAFCCNTTYANFKELSGKGTRDRVEFNKNLSVFSSAFLINQSVTGLYEHKIDLLK
jgi:CRISPR-associated endonuclease Csn1